MERFSSSPPPHSSSVAEREQPSADAGAQGTTREGAKSKVRRFGAFFALVALVIAIDQATKVLIRDWLAYGEVWPRDFDLIRLTYIENSGAAFGILQDASGFLVVMTFIAIAAILAYLFWAPGQRPLQLAALALVLGGAVGNLIDRLWHGAVTDFIDPTNYPAFNIADSAIVIGVATLLVLSLFEPAEDEPGATEVEASPTEARDEGRP